MALLALGSGTYHLAPSNKTLVWDRLPMTISFMAFFSIILGEYLSDGLGARLLWPLVLLGIFSVLFWSYTENLGRGDLRLYVLVQFLPVVLIPMILLMFRVASLDKRLIWAILATFFVSKLAEEFDEPIYRLMGGISGHSIKHLVASTAGILLILAWFHRYPNPGKS